MAVANRSLREFLDVPVVVLAVLAIVIAVWAVKGVGYDETIWYPGGLLLIALLAILILLAPTGRIPLTRPAAMATAALFAYAAWSYASIAWASAPGIAWAGANRTLLYAVVYALCVAIAWRLTAVVAFSGIVAVAVAAVGVTDVARAASGHPERYFAYGRLASPSGYPNAQCALCVVAAFPLLLLASRRELSAILRAGSLAVATVLAELALLTESRASVIAVPLGLVAYFALVPDRLRSLWPVVVAAAGVAISAPTLLAVYDPLAHLQSASHELHRALWAIAITAVAVLVVWAAVSIVDRRVAVRVSVVRLTGAAVVALALVALVVALVVFVAHSPGRTVKNAWHDFRSGYPAATASTTHFSGGLGNNRYDFWRVALNEFRAHPFAGVGADNFAEDYVRERRSNEEPLYPHSLELRVLAQTGIVGAALFVVFVVAAAWAALRTSTDGVLRALARAGLAASAYWFIHGSIDWFWEFPGLAVPAIAWLGLAAASPERAVRPARAIERAIVLRVATAVVALAAAASFTFPWLAAKLTQRAVVVWHSSPAAAFDDLERARALNPLSPAPDITAGAIASRVGDLPLMTRAFRRAIRRDPGNWYAHLELGLALASRDRRGEALRELAVARRQNPLEPIVARVDRVVRSGGRPNRFSVDHELMERIRRLLGR